MEELKKQITDNPGILKNAKNGKIEVVFRQGEAKTLLDEKAEIEKLPLKISGNIGTVAEFIKTRGHLYNPENCRIEVNTQLAEIVFIGNERRDSNDYETEVTGRAKLSSEITNVIESATNNDYEPVELAQYLRKIKHLFYDLGQYQQLFKQLSSFEAEIDRKIKESDDRSGNAVSYLKQEVTHNIDKSFTLNVPVFDDISDKKIQLIVEIDINPTSLNCSLFIETNEIKEIIRNRLYHQLNKEVSEGVAMRDYCLTLFK